MEKYIRSFLKWPGNKYKVLDKIIPLLPVGNRFIEPFVGSGVVFINTNYNEYIIGDLNKDLILLYKSLSDMDKPDVKKFISRVKFLFDRGNNKDYYDDVKHCFNENEFYKCENFIYLNRHGFNGLCRYNKQGKYNVAFGKYDNVYLPECEITAYSEKLKKVSEFKSNYQECFEDVRAGDVIYCDPPFVPLKESGFTKYFGNSFTMADHRDLLSCILSARDRGATVLVSNHDLDSTRELYSGATKIISFPVRRSISMKKETRGEVLELIAIY